MTAENFLLEKIGPDALPNFGRKIILKYKGDTAPSLWPNSYTFNTDLNDKESKAKGSC